MDGFSIFSLSLIFEEVDLFEWFLFTRFEGWVVILVDGGLLYLEGGLIIDDS